MENVFNNNSLYLKIIVIMMMMMTMTMKQFYNAHHPLFVRSALQNHVPGLSQHHCSIFNLKILAWETIRLLNAACL